MLRLYLAKAAVMVVVVAAAAVAATAVAIWWPIGYYRHEKPAVFASQHAGFPLLRKKNDWRDANRSFPGGVGVPGDLKGDAEQPM